jgi:Glycosyltransferase family 10 (fucosyltransferase) C-term
MTAPVSTRLTPANVALFSLCLILIALVFGENPGGSLSVDSETQGPKVARNAKRATRAKPATVEDGRAGDEEASDHRASSEAAVTSAKKAASTSVQGEGASGKEADKKDAQKGAEKAGKAVVAKQLDYSRLHTCYIATGWFGPGGHPWAEGKETTCATGCKIIFANQGNPGSVKPETADLLLFHGKVSDWHYGEGLLHTPRKPGQLRGIMAAECAGSSSAGDFTPILFNADKLKHLDVDVSFRPHSFFRDFQYPLEAIRRWSSNAKTATMESTWEQVTAEKEELHLVPVERRRKLEDRSITFATHHCTSASGREDYVLELLKHVPVEVYGAPCMKHAEAPPEMLQLDRDQQWAMWRNYKFYLSFENYRAPGYFTEKLYLSFIRGQIPVVLGGSDLLEHVPSADSVIDVRDFPTPEALAKRLKQIDEDDEEFMKFFEWRKRPFSSYGRFFREAIEIALPTARMNGEWAASPKYFTCGLCEALARWYADGKPVPSEGVKPFEDEGKMPLKK